MESVGAMLYIVETKIISVELGKRREK